MIHLLGGKFPEMKHAHVVQEKNLKDVMESQEMYEKSFYLKQYDKFG